MPCLHGWCHGLLGKHAQQAFQFYKLDIYMCVCVYVCVSVCMCMSECGLTV